LENHALIHLKRPEKLVAKRVMKEYDEEHEKGKNQLGQDLDLHRKEKIGPNVLM